MSRTEPPFSAAWGYDDPRPNVRARNRYDDAVASEVAESERPTRDELAAEEQER